MKRLLAILLVSFSLIAMHVMAHASGYGIFTQGARALGRADASIAELDSPSAIFFNPALLSDLEGTRGEFGTTLIFPQRSFSGATSVDTEDDFYYPTTLYVSHELDDTLTFGFGLFNPFGLGTDWPNDWEGRYLATRSEIVTFDLRPVIAWQATPSLSLSAGIDYVYLDAELERMVDFSIVPAPDGHQILSGDGDGFGFNLGLSWQLSEETRFGASYRSEVDIDIDAKTTFTVPAPLASFFPTTGAQTDLILPQQFFAGISHKVNDQLLLEFSVRWEDWRAFDQLKIDLNQTVGPPPFDTDQEIQIRDWHDTWAYSLGGEYKLNDETTLLGGYLFTENAVPDTTFEPAIPDSDSHLFCFGVNHQWGSYDFSASYGFQHQQGRSKDNAPANGKYESDLHLVGFSLGYRF